MLNIRYLKSIHTGEKVRIKLSKYKNKKNFYGTVSYIYPSTYSRGKLIKIRISIPNKNGILKIGSFVYAMLKLRSTRLLTVPVSCVAHVGYKDIVLVYKGGGYFLAKSVILGRGNGKYYDVIEGLKPDEEALRLKNPRGINSKTLNKIYRYVILTSAKMKIA
jgi:Cu(I)/Ag(I) efflux system membrane fusion protein